MQICLESRVLLYAGLLMTGFMYGSAAVFPALASDLSTAMEYIRISRGMREVAPGLFLVCLIGAIAFDIGSRHT